ncbi:MAG: ABC transporter ATP-binding protein [Desulfosarcina sp.]|nr:ABC transporter ATP-binding protein [Desulfosarcina sp.]MBC2742203.1 ABC transporter ATP-binding protein [Desulfosarcina sp.]MBC2765115.1 ABC transporter ATP-binding protein [Desulfosarcina sp.]
MTESLLRIENLKTQFFTDDGVIKAVDGVDLCIHPGETLAVVGESGCGKSVTALSVLRLIQSPPGRILEGSKIRFNGQELTNLSDEAMRHIRGNRISMIFQEPMTSLNPVFRAGTQVAEAIHLHQKVTKGQAMEQAVEMMDKVGIPDPAQRAREYPHQLSGGMRQRVMIAMALACNPKLMIADEPTTALDVTIQAQILDLMNALKENFGAAIMLITHDLGVVAEMAQRVVVMYTGQVVEEAGVEELFEAPKHPYTVGLMRAIPNLDTPVPSDRMLPTIPGMVPSLLDLPTGCNFQKRCLKVMDRCKEKAPPLFELDHGHLSRCWLHE